MGARVVVVLGVLTVTGWGVAAGLGAALLVLQDEAGPVAIGLPLLTTVPDVVVGEPALPQQPAPDTYELTVHTDGCGVVRSEGPDGQDIDGLTWSVVDADGFEVLGRNALGETQFPYSAAGTYDVVLQAWGGESYVPVSTTVSVTC